MAEPQFYNRPKGMTVGEIVAMTGATPRDGADLGRWITNVAPIDQAGPEDLSFLENVKFADALASTRAGAVLMSERFAGRAPAGLIVLSVSEPYRAFVDVVRAFYPDALRPASPYQTSGIAPGACVHPTARLEPGVIADPGAVIGPRAEIGAGTIIAANAVVGAQVRIG